MYRDSFPDMLIEHMRGGNSFESFGAIASCGRECLYKWARQYPEFVNALKKGRELCALYYENLGKLMASGQLRRVVREEPAIGPDGKAVVDPRTGQLVMKREYEPAMGNATAWIFLTKNLVGWRDKRDIRIGEEEKDPLGFEPVTNMESEEIREQIRAMAAKALQKGPE